MANKVDHFSEDLAIIQKLDDAPNDVGGLNAEQLKAKFDQGVLALQKFLNEVLIPAHNALCADMANHIQTDPSSVRDNNVSLTAEVVEALGLSGGNPTVKDALLELEKLARLEPATAELLGLGAEATQDDALSALWGYVRLHPETAARLGLDEKALPDEALQRLCSTSVESDKAYVCIVTKYAATGNPASGVAFSGPFSGRTGIDGTYFRACSEGEHTLCFEPVIGSGPIGDVTVTAETGKVVYVNVTLEKANGLQTITESGSYLVGEDVGRMKVCAVGGGGAGGKVSYSANNTIRAAAAGGCGGRVDEDEFDLAGFVGRHIDIQIGAGGEGGSSAPTNGGYAGNQGGQTSVYDPAGNVLLLGLGGEGGVAAYTTGSTATAVTANASCTHTTGRGVGTTAKSGDVAFLDEEYCAGIDVFQGAAGVIAGEGGAGTGYTKTANDTDLMRTSAAGNQSEGAAGSGAGGAGAIGSGTLVKHKAGGSGAVYFMEVS